MIFRISRLTIVFLDGYPIERPRRTNYGTVLNGRTENPTLHAKHSTVKTLLPSPYGIPFSSQNNSPKRAEYVVCKRYKSVNGTFAMADLDRVKPTVQGNGKCQN